jgi:hypothetical protein
MSTPTREEIKATVQREMAQFRLADVTKTVKYAINALPGYKTVVGAVELHAIDDEQSGCVTIVMSDGRRYDVTIQERQSK